MRKPLLMKYAAYFSNVFWLVDWPHWDHSASLPSDEHLCEQGEPHQCVNSLLPNLEEADGILYMHFDAALNPCSFARVLDTDKLGYFNKRFVETKTPEQMDECNKEGHTPHCNWLYWDKGGTHTVRDKWLLALADVQEQFGGRLLKDSNSSEDQDFRTVWMGMDDFFYIPRTAFEDYTVLTSALDKHAVFHEIKGPAIVHFTHRLSGVEIQDFKCWGGVSFSINAADVRSPNFVCGHHVQYNEGGADSAVAILLSIL